MSKAPSQAKIRYPFKLPPCAAHLNDAQCDVFDDGVYLPPNGWYGRSLTRLKAQPRFRKDYPHAHVERGSPTRHRPQVPPKLPSVGKDYAEPAHEIRAKIPHNLRLEVGQRIFVDAPLLESGDRKVYLNGRYEAWWQEGGNIWRTQGERADDGKGRSTIGQHLVMFRNGPRKVFGYPVFKCEVEHCNNPTTRIKQHEHPFAFYCIKYCGVHFREHQRRITLGRVYKANLPPELVKHVSEIIADPDGMAASEELAMAKALTAKLLGHFSETDAFSPESTMVSLKVLDKVTAIAERQAKIAEKQENRLSYKQVLVLLSAAVERLLMVLGKTDDAKNLLYTILPDLPWPAGVARVHGTEGLLGKKGELILPAKPQEKKLTIDADFEGMDTNYEEVEANKIKVVTKAELEELMVAPLDHSEMAGQRKTCPVLQRGECPGDNFMAVDEIEAPKGVPPERFKPPEPDEITHDIL